MAQPQLHLRPDVFLLGWSGGAVAENTVDRAADGLQRRFCVLDGFHHRRAVSCSRRVRQAVQIFDSVPNCDLQITV